MNKMQQYIVLFYGEKKRLISDKEFENMNIHTLLNSDQIKLKIYSKLPPGIYEFKNLEIEVNKYGEIRLIELNQEVIENFRYSR